MVLESLVKSSTLKEKPHYNMLLGIVYGLVAIILSYYVFPQNPSLPIIFFTSLAAIHPLIVVLFKEEKETVGLLREKEGSLLKYHMDVTLAFAYMFFGFFLVYLAAFLVTPGRISELMFSEQIKTISQITGGLTAEEGIRVILYNNFKVLAFSIIFSVLYGAGAVFILSWNSSILAVAVGKMIKSKVESISGIKGYLSGSAIGFLRYFIHGLPEVFAYFLGAVSGGIISAALVRRDYRDPIFYEIIMDALDLIALASLLLIIGALLEVTVTPLIFSKI